VKGVAGVSAGRIRRRLRPPLWTIPAWYVTLTVLAALYLPRLERWLDFGLTMGVDQAAAIAIYSSIASGMIALTGIVFSLAFVMVQFSATAYSPRLVLWIARDPVVWHAVGVFCATFIYALAALAWVGREGSPAVPYFSGWFVLLSMLTSVAMFIALIEKLSLLQVHRMLAFTADYGRRVIEQTYLPLEAPRAVFERAALQGLGAVRSLRHQGSPRSLQALDIRELFEAACAAGAVIEVTASVGDTLVEGMELIRVHGGRPVDLAALRGAFVVGIERTFEQDPKYAIRLIVDIAIRALSPAVNDPTTAVQALDQLEDLLLRLGRRRLETGALRGPDGALRLIVPQPTWDDFLSLAFDEIRHYGADSVQVMRRMKALAADLLAAVPAERQDSLRRQQQRLDATIAASFADAQEKLDASVEDRQGLGVPRLR
jgi:uncharacterized membrane protein